MSFTSYLIRKFDFSHENIFFREFSKKLDNAFALLSGEHIIIGNISCNGHQLDAIFIASGQITIIDFKDYEGKLSFSENNPWRMLTPSNEIVFVQGGAQCRNPFQQVKAYKFSLIDLMSSNEESIFDGPHSNIKWGHIGCIVLFQRNVIFDNNSLDVKISRFFLVKDSNSIINGLTDRHSEGLVFTDNEIRKILKVLDVSESNLFQNYNIEEPVKSKPADAAKLSLIKRILQEKKTDSLSSRLLNYYKSVINLERYKEPSASLMHPFPIDTNQDLSKYSINIAASLAFHQVFLSNKQERFPKNIFIGINVKLEGMALPLLHTIILVEDLNDSDKILVDFNSLELYIKSLEQRGLAEDEIEILITLINQESSFEGKLNTIRKQLDVKVELDNELVIGLSTESLFSVQLQSELNQLSKIDENKIRNNLFNSFLHNKPLKSNHPELPVNPLIQISPLNKSQKKAVQMSFKHQLTVITGPPGTGKSQVVANILANSILNGHSALFVSKNNKAVDNVKERMDKILSERYLIRMGSKLEVENNSKPQLHKLISKKNYAGKEFNALELEKILKSIADDLNRIDYLSNEIDKIQILENSILNYNNKLSVLKIEKQIWLDNIKPEHRILFIEKKLNIKGGINDLGLMLQKIHRLENSILQRFFFNILKKKSFQNKVRNINDQQSEDILNILEKEAPWANPDLPVLDSYKNNLTYLLNLKKASIQLKEEETEKNGIIEKNKNELEKITQQLNLLLQSKPAYETEINNLISNQEQKGIKALNLTISKRLANLNSRYSQEYLDYLPAIVWKDNEVNEFEYSTRAFLKDFNAICLTSLSIKNSFPLREELFDLVVIDEASQCDIASAIPLLYRSKRAVIIGDPLQLTHITSVQKYEDEYIKESLNLGIHQLDYVQKSLYDFCFDLATKSKLESYFLEEHYRCHPEIINFSKEYFYQRKLGQNMLIKTSEEDFKFNNKGIYWKNIIGEMHEHKNINSAEVNACCDLAIKLANTNPGATIGIVTPFRHQYEEIFRKIPNNYKEKVQVDTVHKYQGDEKDIMIFSITITENSSSGKALF